jgi:hypothetical protein
MFIFLPDSPVSAPGLTPRERRVAVERLRGNQTGVENKHLKPYQVLEAFMDYKLYIFFMLGCVCEYLLYPLVTQFSTNLHRQHPQWRYLKLWHLDHQGLWIFNFGHHLDAGMVVLDFGPRSSNFNNRVPI